MESSTPKKKRARARADRTKLVCFVKISCLRRGSLIDPEPCWVDCRRPSDSLRGGSALARAVTCLAPSASVVTSPTDYTHYFFLPHPPSPKHLSTHLPYNIIIHTGIRPHFVARAFPVAPIPPPATIPSPTLAPRPRRAALSCALLSWVTMAVAVGSMACLPMASAFAPIYRRAAAAALTTASLHVRLFSRSGVGWVRVGWDDSNVCIYTHMYMECWAIRRDGATRF